MIEYIKFCEKKICKRKEVKCHPNNKPWLTKELKVLLNQKKIRFAKGDKEQLKDTQKEIKNEINKCKERYKQKI